MNRRVEWRKKQKNDKLYHKYNLQPKVFLLSWRCIKKKKRDGIGSRKEKDMNTMNCLYNIYSESFHSAQFDKHELGLDFIYSSLDKHKRGNCVLDRFL